MTMEHAIDKHPKWWWFRSLDETRPGVAKTYHQLWFDARADAYRQLGVSAVEDMPAAGSVPPPRLPG